MPELPEVEVVKRSLNNKVKNSIIKSVKVNDGKLRYKIDKNQIKDIIGLRLQKISRRSKFLLFFFSKDIVMLVHLGMTGKFFFINQKNTKYKTSFYYDIDEEKDKKHDRVVFSLSRGQKIIYNDVRKFGFIKTVNSKKLSKNLHLKFLGPEPLSNNFNLNYFKERILKRKRKIKDLLMDQKFVSGLGNIYVNEVLYFSKVNPSKNIFKISLHEVKNIIKFTKIVLKKSIKEGGSSIKNFENSDGKVGKYQQKFKVYNRANQSCKRVKCKSFIRRVIISNRSTFFCPDCQK